jgi:hypothetical protein
MSPIFFRANPPFSAEALATRGAARQSAVSPSTGVTASARATAAPAAGAPPQALVENSPIAARSSSVRLTRASLPSVIDVSESPPPPTIIRDGREITAPALNPKRIDDFISHAVPIVRSHVPVAVSQSIPSGTRVAKGTPIDLVLTAVTDLPWQVFDQFHADLTGKTVAYVLPIVADPAVAPLLDKTPATLSVEEKATVTRALAVKGINVVETDVNRNFAVAFQSLRSARAFQ